MMAEQALQLALAERYGLEEVGQAAALRPGTWWRDGVSVVACFDLPRGRSRLAWS